MPYSLDTTVRETTEDRTDDADIPCHGVCDWVVECPYIDLRGNVAPCCIKQKEYLGNLYSSDFGSVWNGERYAAARSAFRRGKLPASCIGCDFANQGRLQYLRIQSNGLKTLKKETRC